MKKQNFFLDILSTVTKYFLGFVIFIIICLLCSGIRIVDSGNVALILRFGHIVGDSYEEQVHKPGLLFAFPSFIDEVVIVPSDEVIEQSVTTHYTDPNGITGWDGGYLMTGDQNIAVVSASVKYIISNPVSYALHVNEIDKIVNSTVSTAMLNEAAHINVDALLTSEKDAYGKAVKKFVDAKLSMMETGVEVISLELTKVSMPNEVKYIYDEVNATTVKAETIKQEAHIKENNIKTKAKESANSMIAKAETNRREEISLAQKEMAEFNGYNKSIKQYNEQLANGEITQEEYDRIKATFMKRISSAKVVEAINKIEKVRIVQDGETKIIIDP